MSDYQFDPLTPESLDKHINVRPNRKFGPPPKVGNSDYEKYNLLSQTADFVAHGGKITNGRFLLQNPSDLNSPSNNIPDVTESVEFPASTSLDEEKFHRNILRKFDLLEKRISNLEEERNFYRRNQQQTHHFETNSNQNSGISPFVDKLNELENVIHRKDEEIQILAEKIANLSSREPSLGKNYNREDLNLSSEEYRILSDDIAKVKNAINERFQEEKRNESTNNKKATALFEEVIRLGKLCEVLNSRQDQISETYLKRFTELESHQNLNENDNKMLRLRDEERIKKLEEEQNSLILDMSELQSRSQHLLEGIRNESQYAASIEAQHIKWAQEMRQELMRCDANFGEKLSKVVADVSAKILWEQSTAEKQRNRVNEELNRDILNMREQIELDQHALDSKLQKFQEINHSAILRGETKFSESIFEVEQEVKKALTEIRREETNRIDDIRSLREEIYNKIRATTTEGQDASTKVRQKIEELEEVVRAEVRSRMRHETKAREHLENTAKALRAASQEYNVIMSKKIVTLESELRNNVQKTTKSQENLQRQVERDIDTVNRNQKVSDTEFKLRLCKCETELSKQSVKLKKDRMQTDKCFEQVHSSTNDLLNSLEKKIVSKIEDTESNTMGRCDEIQEIMQKLDLQLRGAVKASHENLCTDIAKIERNIISNSKSLENKIDNINTERQKELKDLKYIMQDNAVESEVSSIISSMVYDITSEDLKNSLYVHCADLHQQTLSLERIVETKSKLSEERANNLSGKMAQNQEKTMKWQAELSGKLKYLIETVSSQEIAIENVSKGVVESFEKCNNITQDCIQKEIQKIQSKTDNIEVASILKDMVTNLADSDKDEKIASVTSEGKMLRRDVNNGLILMKQEIEDERQISQQLQTHIRSIFASIEDEKERQEREWEKAIQESKPFSLENPTTTSETTLKMGDLVELDKDVTPMNFKDPFVN